MGPCDESRSRILDPAATTQFTLRGGRGRSRIFLLGAAGEQEENGLGASASGPARTLTQNVLLGSRVVSQKVNFLGQGNKGRLISSAVRRRTGEYPPARLLLPGGLGAAATKSNSLARARAHSRSLRGRPARASIAALAATSFSEAGPHCRRAASRFSMCGLFSELIGFPSVVGVFTLPVNQDDD